MVVRGRLQGDPAGFYAAFEKDDQEIVVVPLMHESESLLPAVAMLYESHVHALCNVNRDPRSRCDRISLASHRQCRPKVLVQP
jgi:hypothetical protein